MTREPPCPLEAPPSAIEKSTQTSRTPNSRQVLKAEVIVVPDVGCGVFGNDPLIIGGCPAPQESTRGSPPIPGVGFCGFLEEALKGTRWVSEYLCFFGGSWFFEGELHGKSKTKAERFEGIPFQGLV